MKKEYDYLIIGCGLFGAIFAHEMTKQGKKCLVIERRNHIAGNVYTEKVEGMVRTFFIQAIKKYGNMSTLL